MKKNDSTRWCKKYFVNILQQIDDMLVKKGIKDRYPIQFLIEGVVETEKCCLSKYGTWENV